MAFNALTEYATGQSPQDMALAQIDADNQLDLVSIESSRVVIRLGNADGSFGDPIAPASDIAAERVIAGDFTNDCVTDLMTSQWGQLQLHDGNGDGTFQGSQPIGLPWQWELAHTGVALYGQSANSIATGDLNDDGKLDLAVGGTSSFPDGIACGEYSCGYTFSYKGYVNVLLGTGEGSFNYVDADPSDVDPNAHPLGNFQSAAALAIADLDNDGERDVLAAGFNGGLYVLKGDGTGQLQSPVHSGSGSALSSISLGDVDGDGNLDALTRTGNSLIVEEGQGDGRFIQGAVMNTAQELDSAVLGDVDGDGKLDLVAVGAALCDYYGYGCYDSTRARQASVLLGDGQGGFSLPITSSLGTATGSYSELNDVALADLTGDGLLDLVTIAPFFDGPVIVAANDGNWASPEELSIADMTIVEGNSGSANAVFTVTLTGSTSGPVTVDYVVFDYFDLGDTTAARVGVDYTAPAGTLTFAPGVLSQTIIVPVFGDRLGEGNETFRVSLSNPAGASLRDAEAVGTIVDNEPTLSINHAFGIDPLTVVEGDSGTTPAIFTVTLSQPYDQEVAVDYHAGSGHINDVISASGTLRFAPGETSKEITVRVVGDLIDEPLEAFNVSIIHPSSNAYIGNAGGYGVIEDNDPPAPALSISDASVIEGNSGTKNLNFTVSLASPATGNVTVKYATASGTASAGSDFIAASGTLAFSPGQSSKTIIVPIRGDTAVEPNETFVVNLTNPTGAIIADHQGVGTIVNDDTAPPLPKLNIGDAEIVEGNSGSRTLTFAVTLSQASSKEVRVNYATANGTARTSDNDYVSKSGTIKFPPGQTTKTITVTVKGDKKAEQDEQFSIQLSGAVNCLIEDGQGVGTIQNDDGGSKGSASALHAAAVDAALDAMLNVRSKKRGR